LIPEQGFNVLVTADCELLTVDWFLVIGINHSPQGREEARLYCRLVSGCWFLVSGFWFLVSGDCSLCPCSWHPALCPLLFALFTIPGLKPCNLVTLQPCNLATLQPYHPDTLLPCNLATLFVAVDWSLVSGFWFLETVHFDLAPGSLPFALCSLPCLLFLA